MCVRSCSHSIGIFFFSSRRRHTRLQGDWSSDVCSSDLEQSASLADRGGEDRRVDEGEVAIVEEVADRLLDLVADARDGRSEERRVGKEWRGRWAPGHYRRKRGRKR